MAVRISAVEVQAGDLSVVLEPKQPHGDNPTYYAAQVEAELLALAEKFRAQLEARFGIQYTLEEAREKGAM